MAGRVLPLAGPGLRASEGRLALGICQELGSKGRDKDCILVSFVRSSGNSRACTSSLLGNWHRMNVALTRGKVNHSEVEEFDGAHPPSSDYT
ncbi:hypothetical protein J5N97_000874 [Dioscorea zingiberensis]|uniref:DNA2/NAM7 helicase-like C-terminal domain-containing protein n=1 Tax=Dioscorea zingiberensis TaxID=325984 RepID=A0A9D5BVI5_9LILI|nr:hypothetical protein J5N97_000874 [Dioscorea zingiberensis]